MNIQNVFLRIYKSRLYLRSSLIKEFWQDTHEKDTSLLHNIKKKDVVD